MATPETSLDPNSLLEVIEPLRVEFMDAVRTHNKAYAVYDKYDGDSCSRLADAIKEKSRRHQAIFEQLDELQLFRRAVTLHDGSNVELQGPKKKLVPHTVTGDVTLSVQSFSIEVDGIPRLWVPSRRSLRQPRVLPYTFRPDYPGVNFLIHPLPEEPKRRPLLGVLLG